MLDDAKRGVALKKLRENGLELRERATMPEELDAKRRRLRRFRHRTDRHGMSCFSGAVEPQVGVPIFHRIDTAADRLYRQHQRDGDTNTTRDQRLADAFVTVCESGGKPHATRRDVVIVAGVNTVRTGRHVEGEPCQVLSDDGPITISPEVVRAYLDEGDCFVKLVLHNGVDVTTLWHAGRKQQAELRSALWLGAPPLFHGLECGCGCAKRKGLELDHLDPVANGGPTSVANLDPKCAPSHEAKTKADREAGLLDWRPVAERGPP